MNKELEKDSLEIKEYLDSLDVVKEYKKYKFLYENSPEITSLENHMKFLKKCNMSEEEKEEYEKIKAEYDSNPIVYNYKELEKEVHNLKKEIKYILDI